MFKKQLWRATPFLVLSVCGFLYLLFELFSSGGAAEGWFNRVKGFLLPVIIFMTIVDLTLKYFFRHVLWIVVTEVLLLLCLLYYWIIT